MHERRTVIFIALLEHLICGTPPTTLLLHYNVITQGRTGHIDRVVYGCTM